MAPGTVLVRMLWLPRKRLPANAGLMGRLRAKCEPQGQLIEIKIVLDVAEGETSVHEGTESHSHQGPERLFFPLSLCFAQFRGAKSELIISNAPSPPVTEAILDP